MDFTLDMDTDNAAFTDDRPAEIARILRELADAIEIEGADLFDGRLRRIRDVNGNTIGRYRHRPL